MDKYYGKIRNKVEAEVARAEARGQEVSSTVYENAMVAAAEGINREKNTYILEKRRFVLFHDLMKIDIMKNGCYCFYQKGKMITIARRVNYIDFEKPKDLPVEAEAYFEIRTAEELDPDVLAMIHAMPLL